MISMLVIRPTLNIDVLKMEHAFQMGYKKSNKVFCLSHELEGGGGIFCKSHPQVGRSLEG
jgi:hypothetical protein